MVQGLMAEYAASGEQVSAVSLDTALRISPVGVSKVIVSRTLPRATLDRLQELFGNVEAV